MDAGGGKITLDQESFRALASDVRVDVLKRLDARRETVTDLSNLLGLSKPTLLEHLEKLQSAGLVKRVDEGRKWIYYELSDKGRKILHPSGWRSRSPWESPWPSRRSARSSCCRPKPPSCRGHPSRTPPLRAPHRPSSAR